jgi:hypothetical protein
MARAFPTSDAVPEQGSGYGLPDGAWCARTGLVQYFECAAGHAELRAVPCLQLDCLHCATRGADKVHPHTGDTAKARATRAFDRFAGAPFRTVELTWPDAWNRKPKQGAAGVIGLRRIRWLRSAAARLLQDWAAQHWGVRVGLLVQLHPSGDKRRRWAPHFHAVIPLLGVDHDGRLVDLPKHLDQAGPAWLDMTRRWTGLVRELGRKLNRADLPDRAVWHTAYHVEEPKKRFALRYLLRPFPRWARVLRAAGHAGNYGLLSGGARDRPAHPGEVARWRAMVRPRVDQKPELCKCGSELTALRLLQLGGAQASMLRWAGVPLREEDPDRLFSFKLNAEWWAWKAFVDENVRAFALAYHLGPGVIRDPVAARARYLLREQDEHRQRVERWERLHGSTRCSPPSTP